LEIFIAAEGDISENSNENIPESTDHTPDNDHDRKNSLNGIKENPTSLSRKRARKSEESSSVNENESELLAVATIISNLNQNKQQASNPTISSNNLPQDTIEKSSPKRTRKSKNPKHENSEIDSDSTNINQYTPTMKRLCRALDRAPLRNWCMYEWFYGDIDKYLYKENLF